MEDRIILYGKTKNGFWLFNYNGITQRYLGYSFKESLAKFKELVGLKGKHNITLVRDDEPITYGYMF